jgi:hypothetical protein
MDFSAKNAKALQPSQGSSNARAVNNLIYPTTAKLYNCQASQ